MGKFVIIFVIGDILTHIHAHTYRVQDEVDTAAKMFYCFGKQVFKVIIAGHIGADNRCITFCSQAIQFAHAKGQRRI